MSENREKGKKNPKTIGTYTTLPNNGIILCELCNIFH